MERICLQCSEPLTGRSDQKFCSDYCRSTYNYNTRSDDYIYVKRVQYILRKNWNILKKLNPNGRTKIKRTTLIEKGFKFNYFTNTYTNKKGITYFYIYNKAYILVDEEYVALMNKSDYIE